MAHKKAAGSAKNLRDSQPKYRGVKVFGGQPVVAGNIIIRQKGTKYECGANTYETRDFTIHATIDGIVAFKKKNFKKFNGRTYLKTVVEVRPLEDIAIAKKAKPTAKVKAEPTAKVKAEPTAKVKAEPTAKAKAEPTTKAKAEPAAKAKAKPAAKAKAKPTTKE